MDIIRSEQHIAAVQGVALSGTEEDAMMSNRSNNESTSTHQNATKNYCPMTTNVVLLSYDNDERSVHDGRRTASISQRARLESLHTQERKTEEGVPLCSEVATWRCLPWPTFKDRGNHRRPSAREAGKSSVKNKASSIGWPATAKKIIAVARSNRREPGKLMRDGPSKSLPVSSIHALPFFGKAFGYVLCIRNWVCVESLCVPMKFQYRRDYAPTIVSNIFYPGERIEWQKNSYPVFNGDNYGDYDEIVIELIAGTIKKITPFTVLVTIDCPCEEIKDVRFDKGWLAQHVWNRELRKAIEASIGQVPSKKTDNTPHDAYRLRDPRNNAIFYVGISKNIQRRYKQHLACSGLNFKLNLRIQEILQCGFAPEMEIIEPAIPGAEKARERERYWINHHTEQGNTLTNIAEMDEVK